MSRRKRYLIDKKFQLKATYLIIGIMTILSIFVISAIAFSVFYNNTEIDNILKIQDHIIDFLNTRISSIENQTYKDTLEKISQNHLINVTTLNKIMRYNNILLLSIIIFTIFNGILLYIFLIRRTNRISGPIYVMSNYMRDIINDKQPVPRSLRRKDELKDFYELLKQLVYSLLTKEDR